MRVLLSTLSLLGLLAACTSRADRVAFEGQYFNAKARKVDGQFDVFTVRVKGASRSLAGARAAAEYEAVKYCVNNFGNSDIIWTIGPDTPTAALPRDGDTITYQGTCPQ